MSQTNVTGGWVRLRDPKQVSERLRRPLLAMTAKTLQVMNEDDREKVTPEQLTMMQEFNDLLAVALVEAWSFGDVVSVDALLDLPSGAYDDIAKVVAPFVKDLMPSFAPSPDADSPIVPSNE